MGLSVCSMDPGRDPPVERTEPVPCPLPILDDTMVLIQKQRPQSPHTGTACSLCPAALEPYGCGQVGLADTSPSGSPSAVILPHPVGSHRRWSPVVYSLPGTPGVLLSRKGVGLWSSLGSHNGQVLHGMWLCPLHFV